MSAWSVLTKHINCSLHSDVHLNEETTYLHFFLSSPSSDSRWLD